MKHRKLQCDKNFTPCRVDDGDEFYPNGIFEFNITKMLDYLVLGKAGITVTEIDVCKFHLSYSKIDESHLESVDLSRPVIIAEIAPGRFNLIDGHHRVEKAYRTGVKTLPCYSVGPEHHMLFLTSLSAHEAYVEYWNGKLEDGYR